MRMEVIVNGRAVPKPDQQAVLLDVTQRLRQREEERYARRSKRLSHHPERHSVVNAMLSVERRLVTALWTLARLPEDRGIGYAMRNGVGYLDERVDLYANAVAAGGWLTVPPKPAPPSAKAIDAMDEPLSWLRLLDRDQAKLLSEGAISKRGDMANHIKWSRIRKKLPEFGNYSVRTLQRRYEQALRTIVAELSIRRVGE